MLSLNWREIVDTFQQKTRVKNKADIYRRTYTKCQFGCDCHSGVWKLLLTLLFLFNSCMKILKCDIITHMRLLDYIRQNQNRMGVIVRVNRAQLKFIISHRVFSFLCSFG